MSPAQPANRRNRHATSKSGGRAKTFQAVLQSIWVLFLFEAVLAQSLTQKLDNSSLVDWARWVVRATGNSAVSGAERTQKVEALERAKISAEQNLLVALRQINLNANVQIHDMIDNQSISELDLSSLVQGFTVVDTRSMSDMSIEVDVELPLTGELLNLVLPKETGKAPLRLTSTPLCPCCGQPWPERRAVPGGIKFIVPSEGHTTEKGLPFTGLLVDARDLELRPAVLSRICNEDGEEIYGVGFVTRQIALETGLVAFRKDRNLRDGRVGADPLIIRALKTTGALNSDIVVSNSDALIIHAAAKSQNFLSQCKVVIFI
ncbi:MAG TPA: hypothetical protein VGA99_02855 [bacterium]